MDGIRMGYDERGQGTAEYGLILVLVVLAGAVGVGVFGNALGNTWTGIIAKVVAVL